MAALVAAIGPRELLAGMAALGWVLPVLLLAGLLKNALRALNWGIALDAEGLRLPFAALFRARVASQSVALLASMGSALADPAKSWLIQQHAPVARSIAPTMVEAVAYWFTSLVLVMLGMASAAFFAKAYWALAAAAAACLLLPVLSWLFWTRKSLLRPLSRLWRRRRGEGNRVASLLARAAEVELRVRSFRVRRPGALLLILAVAMVVQALTTAEVALVLAALDVWPGWAGALLVDGFARGSKSVSFFIPGRLGADEASSAGALLLLGLPAAAGVTLALARRAQTMAWAALGLLWLRFDAPARPAPAGRITEELESCKP